MEWREKTEVSVELTSTDEARVTVPLGDRSYDILIGPDLVSRSGAEIVERLPGIRAAVITDENVADPLSGNADGKP